MKKPLVELKPEWDHDYMEQGITESRPRVYFEKPAHPQNEGLLFNNPPVVLCESNHDGQSKQVELTFGSEKHQLSMEPYEIFTIKIHDGKIEKVNLLET